MFHEKPIQKGDCLKRGLGQFVDFRGMSLARMRGWCFYGGRGGGGELIPQCKL